MKILKKENKKIQEKILLKGPDGKVLTASISDLKKYNSENEAKKDLAQQGFQFRVGPPKVKKEKEKKPKMKKVNKSKNIKPTPKNKKISKLN